MVNTTIAEGQAIELERIRVEINRLLASNLLTSSSREKLSARLVKVRELRAEWDRIRREQARDRRAGLGDHPAPLLLPCVRCFHRGACVLDGTMQAEECDGFEPDDGNRGEP